MNNPARLDRINEPKSTMERIDDFALAYAYIILPLCLIILILLFIGLCYAICGISAVESGMLRNFLIQGV